MKFKKGPEPSCYSWARKQRYLGGRRLQPRPVMTQIPALPTLPDIPSLGEIGTVGEGGPQEGIVMPLSVTDRVTLVRNNMYETYLQKSTQKLQDEIHHTMKMYSVEKQQLLKQLATLRHNMSDLKISDNGVSSHHADTSITRHKGTSSHTLPSIIKTGMRDRKENIDNADTEDEDEQILLNDQHSFLSDEQVQDSKPSVLHDVEGEFKLIPSRKHQKKNKTKDASLVRLPQIKEELPRPQWYSGNNSDCVKERDHTTLTALPQIKEMKDIAESSYNIPTVRDPVRCEISIPTKPTTKKVHFAGSNTVREHYHSDSNPQNQANHGVTLPQLPKKKFQMSKPSKKKGSRHSHQLPPIKEGNGVESGPDMVTKGSKGTEEWKSVYVNIHDPEQRTKTLGDILYAVRVRMRENEQKLMYGHRPTEDKTDNTLCDYLLVHKDDQDGIRRTRKKTHYKKGHVPNHTAERLHRRSNAVQLQNYLKKLSRQRRMIEHMEGEEYRLTHIVGHQHLQEAAQKSVQ